eukprot:scaffold33190_cov37-Cyclotella_meneghiniana.AAC.1
MTLKASTDSYIDKSKYWRGKILLSGSTIHGYKVRIGTARNILANKFYSYPVPIYKVTAS